MKLAKKVSARNENQENVQTQIRRTHKFLFDQHNWAALKNKRPLPMTKEFAKCFTKSMRRKNCCEMNTQTKLTEIRFIIIKCQPATSIQMALLNELWNFKAWQMLKDCKHHIKRSKVQNQKKFKSESKPASESDWIRQLIFSFSATNQMELHLI